MLLRKILWLITLCPSLCFSQNEGKVWPMGSYCSFTSFTSNSASVDTISAVRFTREGWASICNSQGELQFFSNGIEVYEADGSKMPFSDSLQKGLVWPLLEPDGIPGAQNMIALPRPSYPGQYYLFYNSITDALWNINQWVHPDMFCYALIDMNYFGANQPYVWLSQQIIYQGNIGDNRVTACQHGNGRDWWIVIHGYDNNEYIRFLLSPDGVSQPEHQFIGPSFGEPDAGAFARFSPDGNHYATATGNSALLLMDFDRCAGLFSNPISFPIALDTLVYQGDTVIAGGGIVGLEYSPSGRFLYINNIYTLTQYDLQATVVEASRQLIFWWNPSYNCQRLHAQQCASNGKIHIATWDGGNPHRFHVIHSPDSLGIACNFVPSSFPVPTDNPSQLPNLPRFGLGALTASGCDTLPPNSIAEIETENVQVSPNPSTSKITITAPIKNATVEIKNAIGRSILHQENFYLQTQIDISKLTPGLYYITLKNQQRKFATKLIKQ